MVVKIDGSLATVDVYGARREISLLLMPEDVKIGDFVLVHAGFAIQRVDHKSAEQSLKDIKHILESSEGIC